MKTVCNLFRSIFDRHHQNQRDKSVKRVLQGRAWIFHILYTITMIFRWANGTAPWLVHLNSCFEFEKTAETIDEQNYQYKDCISFEYREDQADDIRPTA